MRAGPISQLRISEGTTSRRSPVTVSSRSYLTLASTGYIISSSPSAMGSDTPPTSTVDSAVPRPDQARPRIRPTTIARAIQAGRNRSRVDRRLATGPALGAEPLRTAMASSAGLTASTADGGRVVRAAACLAIRAGRLRGSVGEHRVHLPTGVGAGNPDLVLEGMAARHAVLDLG